MDKKLKITDYLAMYGACLSSIVFIWNVRRATSRVKIELVFGIEEIDRESVGGVFVCIKNPSAQTVHLARISPLYPSERVSFIKKIWHLIKYRQFSSSFGWVHTSFSYFDIDDGCPLSLESGKSHSVFIPEEKVKEILKNASCKALKAVAQDELWRNKYSKEFQVENLYSQL